MNKNKRMVAVWLLAAALTAAGAWSNKLYAQEVQNEASPVEAENEASPVETENETIPASPVEEASKPPSTIQQEADSKIRVNGLVRDENGEPMIGATVRVKGTSKGTKTNFEGKFTINVDANATLAFSFIGYKKQEVAVNGRTDITVRMEVEARSTDEVIVIGYGVQKKEDLTGSVTPVSEKDFNKGVINTPTQLLTGKVAGLQMVSTTGEPGASSNIRIRGGTSISGSNEPLYVIDGLPMDNGSTDLQGDRSNALEANTLSKNPLNSINPNDIESIVVLKDASATAIYGSRGANGVILITTKKASQVGTAKGRLSNQVSYDGYVGFSAIMKRYDVFTPSEWADASNYTGNRSELVDYQNEAFQAAAVHNHNLAFSGGINDFSYRVSGSFLDQQGVLKNSYTQRLSGRANLEHNMFDQHLKVNGNFALTYNKDKGIPQSQTNGYEGGVITHVLKLSPSTPIYNSDGGYNFPPATEIRNPIAMLDLIQDISENVRNFGNVRLSYKFHGFEDLSVRLNLGYDITNRKRSIFYPKAQRDFFGGSGTGGTGDGTGRIIRENYYRESKTLETYLNYNRDFKDIKSNFNVIVGYSYQDFLTLDENLTVNELATDGLAAEGVGGIQQVFKSNKEGNKLISVYGRANFDLLSRFLFTATIRADGSSRFGSQNAWGYFPSGAIAWKIAEEEFMKQTRDVLSQLKLRVSYGVVGNQAIGNYKNIGTYAIGATDQQVIIDGIGALKVSNEAGNSTLRWEETSTLNAGLDFGFLENRFTGSVEFYLSNTTNLLFNITAVHPSTVEEIFTNIGSLRNMGVEIAFNGYLVDIPNVVTWNLGLAAQFNQITVTKLYEEGVEIQTGQVSGGGATGTRVQRVAEGQVPYYFYGKREDGTDGYLGKPNPDVVLGMTNYIRVYDFDLAFTLRAHIGNQVYNNSAAELASVGITAGNKFVNTLSENSSDYTSYKWVEDASFLRLDNITLGYNFRYDNFRLRVYATAQNLFVITGYSGQDPEVSKSAGDNGIGSQGIDYMGYPRSATFIFGINLTL